MTVDEFISGYNKAADKEKYVTKNIKNEYVPYEEKIDICTRIVEATLCVQVGEDKIFHRNSPVQYMLFVLNLINLYSTIDIDFSKALEQFNNLERNNLLDIIISSMPDGAYMKFDTILHMIIDDEVQNNFSLNSIINNLLLISKRVLELGGVG